VYAAVNIKRNLRSMYCSIEANDRHAASRGLFATAELLVLYCGSFLVHLLYVLVIRDLTMLCDTAACLDIKIMIMLWKTISR